MNENNDDNMELSEAESEECERRLETLRRDVRDMEDNMELSWRQSVALLAGARLDKMLADKAYTMQCIDDSDPCIRRAALGVAMNHWGLTLDIARQCESIAIAESDVSVRTAALGVLSNFHHGTRNARVGHMLGSIVCDIAVPSQIRILAYLSLISLQGEGLSRYLPEGNLDFSLELVDWNLVKMYYNPA